MYQEQFEKAKKFAESGKPYFQIFVIYHSGKTEEYYLPAFSLARLCEKQEKDNKRYFGRIAEIQLWKMQNGNRVFQYVDGKKPAKEEPKKEVEQIAYSVRDCEGKEVISINSENAIDYAIAAFEKAYPNGLFVHKLVKESLGGEYRDLGTVRTTVQTFSYYVWCDDVKKRDFYGRIDEMNSNGYFEKEFDKLDDAIAYAESLAKDVSIDDDYLVYIERITRQLDEDGDVLNEENEDVRTIDRVEEIRKETYEEDRFALDKIKRNIVGTDEVSELARVGINRLLETDIRFDYVINHAFLDCFEFESEIRDLDEIADVEVNDELIEKAVRLFIATADRLGIELRHASEY